MKLFDQIRNLEEDVSIEQIPFELSMNLPSNQSLDVGNIEKIFPEYISLEVLWNEIHFHYMYASNYLNFETFNSLHLLFPQQLPL